MRLFLAIALTFSTPASAQHFNGHGFFQVPSDGDLDDFILTWRTELFTAGEFGVGGLFEYAEQPLVTRWADGTERVMLDDLVGVNWSGAVALNTRMSLGVSVPTWFDSRGEDGIRDGTAWGDTRLYLQVNPSQRGLPDVQGFRLGFVPWFEIPTGDRFRYLGYTNLNGGIYTMPSVRLADTTLAAHVGFDANEFVHWATNRGPYFVTSVGVSQRLSGFLAIHLENNLRVVMPPERRRFREWPGELLLSLHTRDQRGLFTRLGFTMAYTRGRTAARYRLFLGAGWTNKVRVNDADGDGYEDLRDECPYVAESFNEYRDFDGCPDALAQLELTVVGPEGAPVDNARVAITPLGSALDPDEIVVDSGTSGSAIGGADATRGLTSADGTFGTSGLDPESVSVEIRAPATAGLAPFRLDLDLEEGPNTLTVRLGWAPGAVRVVARDEAGAPVDALVVWRGPGSRRPRQLGADGEQTFVLGQGQWQLLAVAEGLGTRRVDIDVDTKAPGPQLAEVVFAPPTVAVTREEVVLLEPIPFAFDSAELEVGAQPILEEVAANLLAFPEIARIEVQGHTSNEGPEDYNLELSQRRVEAVVSELRRRGVEEERLVPVGYGESCPLNPEQPEGNRRVQLVVLDPAPDEGVPCHGDTPARQATPTTIERTEPR